MHGKTVVGLGFQAQVGKDTTADYMVEEYGFQKTSFATALKEGIGRGVFGLSDDQLYGHLKQEVDHFWDQRLNIYEVELVDPINDDKVFTTIRTTREYDKWENWYDPEYGHPKVVSHIKRLPITPRLILQLAGTEGGREIFGQPLWVETVARRISDSEHDKWVIPDVRFPNEAEAVLEWGGLAFRVERDTAEIKGGTTAHASETSLLNFDRWTDTIYNNSSFQSLYEEVDQKIISRI